MQKTFVGLFVFSLFFSPLSPILVGHADAAINKQINYQGKLMTSGGVAVPDGTYNMEFKLYATSTTLWTETRTGANKVTVSSGLFSIMLGEVTALSAVDFNQPLFLGVNIGGTSTPSWDGEMSPRKPLGSVPQAIVAETLSGITAAEFFRSDAVNATNTASTFLDITQNGTGDIATFTGTSSILALAIKSNGNIGVGSSTPIAKLSVTGSGTGAGKSFSVANSSNTENFTVLDSGNVGIGTAKPLRSLHVVGPSGPVISAVSLYYGAIIENADNVQLGLITGAGRAAGITFGDNSSQQSGSITYDNVTDSLSIRTNGTDNRLFIDSSGYVGIGTTTPNSKFSVAGDINLTGALRSNGNAGTNGQVLQTTGSGIQWVATSSLGFGSSLSGGTNGYLSRWTGASTLSSGISIDNGTVAGINATSSSYTYNIKGAAGVNPFNVASSTGTSLFTVLANGNVGIGSTTPTEKLSVVGNALITGTVSALNFTTYNSSGTSTFSGGLVGGSTFVVDRSTGIVAVGGIPSTSWTSAFQVRGNQGNNSLQLIENTAASAAEASIHFKNASSSFALGNDSLGKFQIANYPGSISAVQYLTILPASGNVGIGSTTPGSKLSVVGDLNLTGAFRANGNVGTSGYVLQTTGASTQWVATSSLGFQAALPSYGTAQILYGNGSNIPTSSAGFTYVPGALLFSGDHSIAPDSAEDGSNLSIFGGYLSSSGQAGHLKLVGGNSSGGGAGGSVFVYGGSNGSTYAPIILGHNGTIQAGNVGVGTTTPNSKFSVAGDINLTGALRSNGNAGTNGQILQTTGAGVQWVATSSLGIGGTPAGSTGYVQFNNGGSFGADSGLFWDNSSKRLGINTTSPGAKLSIDTGGSSVGLSVGSTTQSTSIATFIGGGSAVTTIDNAANIVMSYANGGLKIGNQFAQAGTDKWASITNRGGYGEYLFINAGRDPSNVNGAIVLGYDVPGNVGILENVPGSKLSVKGNLSLGSTYSALAAPTSGAIIEGNVGIGTTTPADKLVVAGNITTTGIINIPTSSSTAGLIKQNGSTIFHTYGTGNIFTGGLSGNYTLTGTNNQGFGYGTLLNLTSGSANFAAGYLSLDSNTSGTANTAIGSNSLQNNISGNYNAALGASALYNNTSGYGNFAAGYVALTSNTTGYDNTAIGRQSMQNTATGTRNVAIGAFSLFSNTGGDVNVAIGNATLYSNTTGGSNVAIGNTVLYSNTTGLYNIGIGQQALNDNTTGNSNFAAGTGALFSNTTGDNNVAIGNSALLNNTTAIQNFALGTYALHNNTSGSINVAIGGNAMYYNTTGFQNTAIAISALQSNTSGYLNTGIGPYSLYGNTSGYNNVGIGLNAGYTATPANANTTGYNNTYIGTNSGPSSPTQFYNSTAIGANALVGASNALVLGDNNVNVGIGTAIPTASLQVESKSQADQLLLQKWSFVGADYNLRLKQVVTAGIVTYAFDQTNNSTDYSNVLAFNNGKVGIGTVSPSTKLQVGAKVADDNTFGYTPDSLYVINQTQTGSAVLNDPQNVLLLGRQGTSGQAYGAAAAFNLSRYENNSTNSRTRLDIALANAAFDATSNTVMTFLSNGNIGIGSTTPGAKLSVAGDINLTGALRANGNAGTSGYILQTTGTGVQWVATSSLGIIGGSGSPGGSTGYLQFNNSGTFAGDAGLFWDNTNKRLGLGTTTPAARLGVVGIAGNANVLNVASSTGVSMFAVTASGNIGIGTTNPQAKLSLGSDVTTQKLLLYDGGNNRYGFGIQSYEMRQFVPGDSHFSFGTISTADGNTFSEKVRIDGVTGNVGIGTSTPNAKLGIYGTAGSGDIFAISSSSNDRLVTVDANGNVGIGTSTPAEKLHVAGNIFIGAQQNSTDDFNRISSTTPGVIGESVGATSAINNVAVSVVYNGSLYVGTVRTATAEVYRYNGNGSWTQINTGGTAGTMGTTASIDSISAMTVYNGSLYIGTSKVNGAGVFRYDGGTTWTELNPGGVDGKFLTTTNIDGVSAMTVHNGILYIGTSETNAAQVYRYQGGTVWTVANVTAGTFITQTAVDAVSSMISYNRNLYIGTTEATKAQVVRLDGNTTWVQITSAAGTFNTSVLVDGVPSMALYNGALYIGTNKFANAEVFRFDPTISDGAVAANLQRVSVNASGTIAVGGTTAINSISSMGLYNGNLYVGTSKANSAEIYKYDSVGTFVKVSNATAGSIPVTSPPTSSITSVNVLQTYNGKMYAMTSNNYAEIYEYNSVEGQSYSLKFNAVSNAAGVGEQNGLFNTGSLAFYAEEQSRNNKGTENTGRFVFSHGVNTAFGAYDVAEDYPTRDDTLEAGDVVTIDTAEKLFVKKSTGKNDKNVIGIYSEQPALRLSQQDATIDGATAVPIALAGRVPVKVSLENGPIKIGDYLTTGTEPGTAARANTPGRVIGRALSSYSGAEGEEARVTVFIGIQTITWNEISQAQENITELAQEDAPPQAVTAVEFITTMDDAVADIALAVISKADNLTLLIANKVIAITASIKNLFVDTLAITPGGKVILPTGENQIAGVGMISAGQSEIFIANTQITANSIISITPTSAVDVPLFVSNKNAGVGFTVRMIKPATENIEFDWFFVNTYKINGNITTTVVSGTSTSDVSSTSTPTTLETTTSIDQPVVPSNPEPETSSTTSSGGGGAQSTGGNATTSDTVVSSPGETVVSGSTSTSSTPNPAPAPTPTTAPTENTPTTPDVTTPPAQAPTPDPAPAAPAPSTPAPVSDEGSSASSAQ